MGGGVGVQIIKNKGYKIIEAPMSHKKALAMEIIQTHKRLQQLMEEWNELDEEQAE